MGCNYLSLPLIPASGTTLLNTVSHQIYIHCYASMPPPLGSERIMFLGSLSVIPSIYLSIQPTITQVTNQPTDFLSIHLSIHLEVLGHFLENTWEEWPKFGMLIYPDHLQKWLDFGHGLWIFLILATFWFNWTGQIWGFQTFPWECMGALPEIWHANVSWPPSDFIQISRGHWVNW